ncbi:MAG TPA: hypothetical protein VIL94_02205, partial [Acidothermaceae bacterium]
MKRVSILLASVIAALGVAVCSGTHASAFTPAAIGMAQTGPPIDPLGGLGIGGNQGDGTVEGSGSQHGGSGEAGGVGTPTGPGCT